MRVALDATPLMLENGGLRRYTSELTAALRAEFPQDEYLLLSDQPVPPRNVLLRRWWSCGLPLELLRRRVDVFHGTDFAVPYLPVCPSVMTVHDLSPWLDPSWHDKADRVRRRTPVLIRLGLTRRIITPTEAIRRQVIEHLRMHPDRVVSIPEAASAFFRPETCEPVRPYFLFVGTLEPRKNVATIVDAWSRLQHSGTELLLAGRQRSDFEPVQPRPGLRFLGSVPDSALPSLYSGAIAVLYPSLYEGFGLPLIEAMQCGAPVLTSRDAALVEVAGGAAIHLHALDTAQWVEAMTALLHNNELRGKQVEASLRRASLFSWQKTARLTREVYLDAQGA